MSSNPDHIENLNKLKALGFDVEEQLEDTFESWGYDEQVYLMQGIIPKIRNLAEQNKSLMAALNEVRSMVTDVQDGFDVTGSDAEILEVTNKALEQAK